MSKFQLNIGRYKELPKEKYTFYSPESGYMLVFTDKDIDGFIKVAEEKENRLTADERAWLRKSKTETIKSALKNNQKEYTEVLNNFLDKFEDELKKEVENGKAK